MADSRGIPGARIHVAAGQRGLLVSIVRSPANEHDSTRFIDTMENISEFACDELIQQITTVHADKVMVEACIRHYLRGDGIGCRIPYKKNSKSVVPGNRQDICNKARFAVEGFLAWLRCGCRRTATRYERSCENCLGSVYLTCIMTYWRVLG